MMDYTTTKAWSLGPLLPPHNQWGIDEVNRLYYQFTEIHSIGTAQLEECARWRCSDANPRLIRFRTD
jgi:hypothetical protein